ncbi:CDP-alcohol phosphatidyltransferase family protein [Litoribrevibacter albus]|nr:CDP-alcohol phosphatidyltransferase family protein [Litoribrevibacter albus]
MSMAGFSWIPNALTILRCLLVAPVAWFIYQQQFVAALLTFGFAGFTDGLDGFLARRYQWQSYLGSILDPIADKLLMTVSYIVLTAVGLLPPWLMFAVVLRDVVIILGASVFRWLHGPYMMSPSKAGKLSTFLQILLVLWLLIVQAFSLSGQAISMWLIWMTLAVTVYSGMEYVVTWFKKSKDLKSS